MNKSILAIALLAASSSAFAVKPVVYIEAGLGIASNNLTVDAADSLSRDNNAMAFSFETGTKNFKVSTFDHEFRIDSLMRYTDFGDVNIHDADPSAASDSYQFSTSSIYGALGKTWYVGKRISMGGDIGIAHTTTDSDVVVATENGNIVFNENRSEVTLGYTLKAEYDFGNKNFIIAKYHSVNTERDNSMLSVNFQRRF